jgi:diguanylate cyclase (GGDEF)-like protein
MFLDQFSILIAVGFSGASLGLTLFMLWVVGRAETHLLSWSLGLAFIVGGVVFFSYVVGKYDANLLLASFVLLIIGFGLLYSGTAKFCADRANAVTTSVVVVASLLITSVCFGLGYSGLGTIAGNVAMGILLALSGHQYWEARKESPFLMTANAVLFFITSLSFIACGYALIHDGQFVLNARPDNWAEEINSIVVIMGLTGIGTLSLTLNQARIANRHKSDARTDVLTGLLNRRALLELDTAIPPNTSVIAIDVDHFKAVNDRFGHDAGDHVLKVVAETILGSIRSHDFAARIGGEEFCVVLPNSSRKSSTDIAERLRRRIEGMTIPTAAGSVRTTISAGIAFSAAQDETIQSLLNKADQALYEAKSSGRNRIQVSGFSLVA